MGKTFKGGTSHVGNIDLLTPEQKQLLSQAINTLGPQFVDSLSSLMGPQSQEQNQEVFQQSYVDPAMQMFEQQLMPSIQQRFVDANAGSSSALNQALSQGAKDISTSIGSQYGNFLQNQKQNQFQALGAMVPLISGKSFSPMIQQQQGILGPMLGAAGSVGAGMMMSSKKVKENIEDYTKGMEEVRKLEVKKYDYIKDVGGQKNKVGLIAEDLPTELTAEKDEVLHVDLYGVIGLLINAMKDLDKRMKKLEGKK